MEEPTLQSFQWTPVKIDIILVEIVARAVQIRCHTTGNATHSSRIGVAPPTAFDVNFKRRKINVSSTWNLSAVSAVGIDQTIQLDRELPEISQGAVVLLAAKEKESLGLKYKTGLRSIRWNTKVGQLFPSEKVREKLKSSKSYELFFRL